MPNKVSFIYCIEKGELAKQTILSIKSLRRNGGVYATSRIYCVCPNAKRSISENDIASLQQLDVIYLVKNLNEKYEHNPLANKPLVCAYVESIDDHDFLVFLDSDTIIINCLKEILPKHGMISCTAVIAKNIGTQLNGDENIRIWNQAFNAFRIQSPLMARTLITNEEIIGYWNSGVIVIKNDNHLFKDWLAVFEKLYEDNIVPEQYSYFIEQFSLSLLIHQNWKAFEPLPDSFNYDISNHKYLHATNRLDAYHKIHILHYHKIFLNATFNFPLPKLDKGSAIRSWIKSQVKDDKIYPLKFPVMIKHFFGRSYFKIKQTIKFSLKPMIKQLK